MPAPLFLYKKEGGKGDFKMKYQLPNKLKYGKWGLIFILPFFIAYGIFNLYPLIMTFYNSFFSKYEDLFDTVVQFVGFDNYVKVFTEGQILKYFGNTFLLWLLGFIPQILISMINCFLVYGFET